MVILHNKIIILATFSHFIPLISWLFKKKAVNLQAVKVLNIL